MPQYLSTDPNAGTPPVGARPRADSRYLSTDPNAGSPTRQTADDEPSFRRWYGELRSKYGMPIPEDPDATPLDVYDYRAAFRAGDKPTWFAGNENDPPGYHLGGSGKGKDHPTRVVGGFDTKTGERVPGTPQASEAELVRLGWSAADASRMRARTDSSPYLSTDPAAGAAPEDRRSTFARAIDVATTPLVPQIGRAATRLADVIDTAPNPTSAHGGIVKAVQAIPDVARHFFTGRPMETIRGLEAGAVEGLGGVVSQLTSPLDAALTAVGLRSLRSAAPAISRGLDLAANAALALRGAERVIDAEDVSEGAAGALQTALGAVGGRVAVQRPRAVAGPGAPPAGVPVPAGALPAGARRIVNLRRRETPEAPAAAPAAHVADRPPVATSAITPRRRELLDSIQGREAFVDPARMNAVRAAADTGDILTRPTAATPRPITTVNPLQRPATEVQPPKVTPLGVPVDQLPAVRAGRVTRDQGLMMSWLVQDMDAMPFEQGGSSLAARRRAYETLDPEEAHRLQFNPHVAGTPTQQMFQALGVDLTRPDTAAQISNFLTGAVERPGRAAQAAIGIADVMREGWDAQGQRFDWHRVRPETLTRVGLRQGDLRGPVTGPQLAGQPHDLAQRYFPTQADEAAPDFGFGAPPLEPASQRAGERRPQPIDDPFVGLGPLIQRMPDELQPAIHKVLVDNQGFADQRRGVHSFAATDRLARQLAVDVSTTLPKGSALNAEQIRAYANAVATTGQKVKTLTDKVTAATATDVDLVALEAARQEHATVLASMMGARAEAGRALSSFRMFSRVLETGDTNLIRAALKAPGMRTGMQDLARQLAAVGDDPLARYQFLAKQAKPTWGDKFRSYYYANILSGIKTGERNFLGNAFNSLANLATVPVTAAIDVARSRVTGQPRQVFARELPSQVVGGLIGTQRGFKDFVFTLRHGISPRNLSGTLDAATSRGAFDLPRVELGGGGANPFNWPGRMLEATDAFFRSIARNQEWYGLAYAQARREGLTGAPLTDRMAALKAEDSPLARSLDTQADAYATRAVFQEEPGQLARWLQRGSQAFPPFAFVIPFIKTPANILRQGAEFSPAGAVMSAARQPGRAGVQAQGRVALGTMLMAPLAWLAATGRLSGSGPQDSAERAAKMEAGWRPNSVKLRLSPGLAQQLAQVGDLQPAPNGEYWVSYSLFQPVSVPASVVANTFESWQAMDEKGPPSVSTVATAVMRTGRSVLDQSYLSGLFDVLEAIDNPDAWASRYLARVAHSLTPFAGAQRSVQQAMDPTVRQPKGFAESFQATVPGLSPQVPARLDRFGEEITREGNAAMRAADPFNISPARSTPVARELARLGVDLSLPNARIELRSGRVLTREEEYGLRQSKGRAVGRQLGLLLENPTYGRLTDDGKRRAVLRVIDRARSAVTRQTRAELAQ